MPLCLCRHWYVNHWLGKDIKFKGHRYLFCNYKGIQSAIHKNIERHTADTTVSWPNPKQWVIVHTSLQLMHTRIYDIPGVFVPLMAFPRIWLVPLFRRCSSHWGASTGIFQAEYVNTRIPCHAMVPCVAKAPTAMAWVTQYRSVIVANIAGLQLPLPSIYRYASPK